MGDRNVVGSVVPAETLTEMLSVCPTKSIDDNSSISPNCFSSNIGQDANWKVPFHPPSYAFRPDSSLFFQYDITILSPTEVPISESSIFADLFYIL